MFKLMNIIVFLCLVLFFQIFSHFKFDASNMFQINWGRGNKREGMLKNNNNKNPTLHRWTG